MKVKINGFDVEGTVEEIKQLLRGPELPVLPYTPKPRKTKPYKTTPYNPYKPYNPYAPWEVPYNPYRNPVVWCSKSLGGPLQLFE